MEVDASYHSIFVTVAAQLVLAVSAQTRADKQ